MAVTAVIAVSACAVGGALLILAAMYAADLVS